MMGFCCCCNDEKIKLTIFNGYLLCESCYNEFMECDIYNLDEINIFIYNVKIGEHKHSSKKTNKSGVKV